MPARKKKETAEEEEELQEGPEAGISSWSLCQWWWAEQEGWGSQEVEEEVGRGFIEGEGCGAIF